MRDEIINRRRLQDETAHFGPMTLAYRIRSATPADDHRFAAFFLTAASLMVFAIVAATFLLRTSWASPWILASTTALGFGLAVLLLVKRSGIMPALLALIGVPLLPIVLTLLAGLYTNPLRVIALVAVAVGFLAYLADKVASHFVAWLLADHRITPEQRTAGLQRWSARLGQSFSLSTMAYLSVLGALPFLTFYFILVSYQVAASAGPIVALCIPLVTLVLVSVATLSLTPAADSLRGLVLWLTYAGDRVAAPGVFQSPSGTRASRLWLTVSVLFLLSFSVIPASGFFHVLLDRDHDPWEQVFGAAIQSPVGAAKAYSHVHGFQLSEFKPTAAIERIPDETADSYKQRLDRVNESMRAIWVSENFTRFLQTHPAAWTTLAVDGLATGKPVFVWAIIVAFACGLFVPVLLLCITVAASTAMASAIIGPTARKPEGRYDPADFSDWHCFVERLRKSPNELERDHLWLGVHAEEDYPVVLHRSILNEHAYIVGDTGSGKTALGLTPLLLQLLDASDAAIVVIDLKGDPALFHSVREKTAAIDAVFKYFTNELGKPTYTFNPFLQVSGDTLSLNQVCENILEALNLNHGEGYGRSYFSRVARHWLANTLQQNPHINSFTQLCEFAADEDSFVDDKERQDAFELISVIQSLASFEQLNITPQSRRPDDTVFQNAIYMPDVVANGQVVYFWLPALIETASVREIAKLAIYALVRSAFHHTHKTGTAKQVYLVIDEFQRIASGNFKLILEQARSMGVGVILANQTMADLQTPDTDLRPAVQTNTRFKQCFSAVDLEQQDFFMKASGEALDMRAALGYEPVAGTLSSGWGLSSYRLNEYTRPRLQRNDIIRTSDDPLRSIIQVHRGSGYTQFSGFSIPIAVTFPVTRVEYERLASSAWPDELAGHTITPTHEPLDETPIGTPEARIELGKQLAAKAGHDLAWGEELDRLREELLAESERRTT